MQINFKKNSFAFALALSIFVSAILASLAGFLQKPQELSARLDIIQNILSVAGYEESLLQEWKKTPTGKQKMIDAFRDDFEILLIDKDSEAVEERFLIDALLLLNYKKKDLEEFAVFELLQLFNKKIQIIANKKKQELADYDPQLQLVFKYKRNINGIEDVAYIVPVEGYGLWDMIYSYIAFEKDINTIRNIRFYEHKETPGLGGECSKPWFTNQFKQKKIIDDAGNFRSVTVAKGKASDSVSEMDLQHYVDGMSGGTITGNGITKFLSEDLQRYNKVFTLLRESNQEIEEGVIDAEGNIIEEGTIDAEGNILEEGTIDVEGNPLEQIKQDETDTDTNTILENENKSQESD